MDITKGCDGMDVNRIPSLKAVQPVHYNRTGQVLRKNEGGDEKQPVQGDIRIEISQEGKDAYNKSLEAVRPEIPGEKAQGVDAAGAPNGPEGSNGAEQSQGPEATKGTAGKEPGSEQGNQAVSGNKPEESIEFKNEVQTLANRENEVIAHEQAHQSVGGSLAGSASYSYTVGPDGKRYIAGGEVSISIPSSDDPEVMLGTLERVKMAALAPAKPSGQDMSVAASASSKQMTVRAQIAQQRADKVYGKQKSDKTKGEGAVQENQPVEKAEPKENPKAPEIGKQSAIEAKGNPEEAGAVGNKAIEDKNVENQNIEDKNTENNDSQESDSQSNDVPLKGQYKRIDIYG